MKKASVKILLKKNKEDELGKTPIYIRITANRKTSFISTGHKIQKRYWDEKNEMVKDVHKYADQINRDITSKKKEILDDLINASIKGQQISAKDAKDLQTKKLNDIFQFADQYIIQAKNNKEEGTVENYEKHLKKLEQFQKERVLNFEDITVDYLYSFEEWLRGDGVKRRKGKDPSNYIAVIMRTIRKFFNVAKSRGIISCYPFTQYELPKTSGGNKPYLTLKELAKWHEFTFETENNTYKESALYFLFACYSGLRLSDWSDFTEAKIKDRNISLKATKNKSWVAVPLHDKFIEVIHEMKKVPLTISEPTLNGTLKKIAEYLKVNKSLSTHSGRKTFAVTMCLERGVSAETAAKLMGITLAVFENNYSFITPDKIMLETSKAWKDFNNS
jgi:integrase/recombinase XerD